MMLFIFDRYDKLLCKLSNSSANSCPFWDAYYERRLPIASFFEFSTEASHQHSKYIAEHNQVGFFDRERKFRLFTIETVEEASDSDGDYIRAIGQASILELLKKVITDRRPQNQDMRFMLDIALERTRYKVGYIAPLGVKSTSFFMLNSIEVINKISELFGAEVEERIEIDDTGITGRYIDLLSRLGRDTGKILELTKDVMSMVKTTSVGHIATALYGRGASVPIEDEDGELTGGYSRRIDFANIEWSVANGDPLDKPLGQVYLEDPQMTEIFGLPFENGHLPLESKSEHHNIQDPNELLMATYLDLQQRTKPFYNFIMDVFMLGDLIGYEAHKINLGDTVRAVNRRFTRPILAETRVIMIRYDVANPQSVADIELGHFINLYGAGDRLADLEREVGIIGSRPQPPITDESISPAPQPIINLSATGLFRTVNITWDNQRLGNIFELHASQVQGFIPSVFNMIYRGPANGFNHAVETDQQWFYRVRSVNVRGEIGSWSQEVVAQTIRVDGDHIEHLAITDAHILSLSADKILTGILRAIELIGVTISGSVFLTDSPLSHIRMELGRLTLFDENNIQSGALIQSRLEFRDRFAGDNPIVCGRFGRLHTAGDETSVLGVHIGAQPGYEARVTSQNPANGLFATRIAVPGGGPGTPTDITNLNLMNNIQMNGNNINTGGDMSIMGDGDVIVPFDKLLALRRIRTTGFSDNQEINAGVFTMNNNNAPETGLILANQSPGPNAGFFIGPQTVGSIHRGHVQNWDVVGVGPGSGNQTQGGLMHRWGTHNFGSNTGASQTWSVTYASPYSNTPNTVPTVICDTGVSATSPTVTLFNRTPQGFSMRLHRNGFTGPVEVSWESTGRRSFA